MNYEDSVRWLRDRPEHHGLVLDAYLDADPRQACERFRRSDEFTATLELLTLDRVRNSRILDLGAGNGIATHAFARLGAQTVSVEPDDSVEVGARAIRFVAKDTGQSAPVVRAVGEAIPVGDASFDIVYARQVLHHARDLEGMLAEIHRVLRPGGVLLAAREHVVDDDAQLASFLANHPLHALHGGENAYSVVRYESAMFAAGLEVERVIHNWGSVLNYWPLAEEEITARMREAIKRRLGGWAAPAAYLSPVRRRYSDAWARADRTPGRLYSFLARK